MKLNETKSKCLIFKKKDFPNDLHINYLDTVDKDVYLEHCIKYNLDDFENIKIKLNKLYPSLQSVF